MAFLRRNYFYGMALLVPVCIVGLLALGSVVALVCAGCWLLQLCGLAVLQAQMHTERRRAER
jgi:hypothetical protein